MNHIKEEIFINLDNNSSNILIEIEATLNKKIDQEIIEVGMIETEIDEKMILGKSINKERNSIKIWINQLYKILHSHLDCNKPYFNQKNKLRSNKLLKNKSLLNSHRLYQLKRI